MTKFRSIALMAICGVIFSAFTVADEDASQKQRAPVGTRAEPFEKQMSRLKARDEQGAREDKKSHTHKDKKHSKPTKTHAKPNPKETNTEKSVKVNAESLAAAKRLYVTTHPAAYQHPVAVSFVGDSVELMDGSIWVVSPYDAYKTINWFPTDLVVISPNKSWFSSYSFRLTNQNTGESVAVNLFLGPIDPLFNSLYTHWVVGIDYYHNTVFLEDGSVWSMSSLDANVVDQWMINDVVIIGVNTGWLSSYNPNILINVNMLNYAAGAVAY